jgi:transposase
MLNGWASRPVYLACGATDLRKSIDGLAAIVQLTFQLDPCSAALFVFCNRGRTKLKILEWDTNGFWLHYKRLEQGHFPWPAAGASGPRPIAARQLQWLLDGLAWEAPPAHRPLRGRRVV